MARDLQAGFTQKTREAVNGVNERGQSALDIVLHGSSNELAETFIQLFGRYLDLSCQAAVAITPRSEIRIIVPGNQ